MSCYIDALGSNGWKLGQNCHLIADTQAELHEMAARIGMKRHWFQPKSSPHYDLTKSRRAAAVRNGVIELNRGAFVAKIQELRAQGWP